MKTFVIDNQKDAYGLASDLQNYLIEESLYPSFPNLLLQVEENGLVRGITLEDLEIELAQKLKEEIKNVEA